MPEAAAARLESRMLGVWGRLPQVRLGRTHRGTTSKVASGPKIELPTHVGVASNQGKELPTVLVFFGYTKFGIAAEGHRVWAILRVKSPQLA